MGGQGCVARCHRCGPCVVRPVRHVVPSQLVPEGVGEEPEEAGVAGGGGCGWGCGPFAVAGVEVPAVPYGAAGRARRKNPVFAGRSWLARGSRALSPWPNSCPWKGVRRK